MLHHFWFCYETPFSQRKWIIASNYTWSTFIWFLFGFFYAYLWCCFSKQVQIANTQGNINRLAKKLIEYSIGQCLRKSDFFRKVFCMRKIFTIKRRLVQKIYFCETSFSNLIDMCRSAFNYCISILYFLTVYFYSALLNHSKCF